MEKDEGRMDVSSTSTDEQEPHWPQNDVIDAALAERIDAAVPFANDSHVTAHTTTRRKTIPTAPGGVRLKPATTVKASAAAGGNKPTGGGVLAMCDSCGLDWRVRYVDIIATYADQLHSSAGRWYGSGVPPIVGYWACPSCRVDRPCQGTSRRHHNAVDAGLRKALLADHSVPGGW